MERTDTKRTDTKRTITKKAAITLFVAAMAVAGSAAAFWPQPTTACTAANEGTFETVYRWTRWGEESFTYYCGDGFWQIFEHCDPRVGYCVAY